MPHFFSFANHGHEDNTLQEIGDDLPNKRLRRSSFLKGFGGLWKKHHDLGHAESVPRTVPTEPNSLARPAQLRRSSLPDDATPRKAVPSLPRPQTFRRQESERREKLLEVPSSPAERRASSVDRRLGLSISASRRPLSPNPVPLPSVSAPDIVNQSQQIPISNNGDDIAKANATQTRDNADVPDLQLDQDCGEVEIQDDDEEAELDRNSLQEEYDRRWILNLSMHFRDKSNREKFFVTYAETPTKWRRITISLDYRNAPEGSLEADLSTLHYQRDKSFRIYEAIRESLPDIQYYNTVTNLKLETTPEDGQLHVHVREDTNEVIQYPSTDLFRHVPARRYVESELEFLSHISGFVYKVKTGDATMIKKEIPGPDTVDEFLYEVNALDSLLGCQNVVRLEGLVTDESGLCVKGLLISYASQGALVDMIFDFRGTAELPWHRREKWAKQVVNGLSAIHEAGFVQGDFTLSNIVIDEDDNAQIIDINRRGCPVGWEPPELGRLIDSGQRISMCIGVKTDLYQLGMVLWALAEEVDEPERVERPLPPVVDDVPLYFQRMVETCLCERPQGRSSAKSLLRQFPHSAGSAPSPTQPPTHPTVDFVEDLKRSDYSSSTHRSDKEYIDPKMAVTIDDVNAKQRRRNRESSLVTADQVEYLDPQEPDSNPASSYRVESSGSWVIPRRGRSPGSSRQRRRSSPFARPQSSSATSLSRSPPPSRGPRRRGSDCSEDAKVAEPPTSNLYPTQIDPRDLEDSPIEICVEEAPSRPPQVDCFQDKRLASVQDQDFVKHSPLQHTDSGFDEQMVEGLDLGPSEAYHEHPQTIDEEPLLLPDVEHTNSDNVEPPTTLAPVDTLLSPPEVCHELPQPILEEPSPLLDNKAPANAEKTALLGTLDAVDVLPTKDNSKVSDSCNHDEAGEINGMEAAPRDTYAFG